jgi:hypothetical protein
LTRHSAGSLITHTGGLLMECGAHVDDASPASPLWDLETWPPGTTMIAQTHRHIVLSTVNCPSTLPSLLALTSLTSRHVRGPAPLLLLLLLACRARRSPTHTMQTRLTPSGTHCRGLAVRHLPARDVRSRPPTHRCRAVYPDSGQHAARPDALRPAGQL